MNYNCSYLSYLRNLKEQVKKLCYQKLYWPFTVWTNSSSDLKIFANSRPSAMKFKNFSRSIEQFTISVPCGKIWKVWKSYLHFPPFWHGFFSLVHSSLSAWYSHRSPANSRFRDGAYFGKAHWQKKSLKKRKENYITETPKSWLRNSSFGAKAFSIKVLSLYWFWTK